MSSSFSLKTTASCFSRFFTTCGTTLLLFYKMEQDRKGNKTPNSPKHSSSFLPSLCTLTSPRASPPPPYLLFFSFADFPCVLPPIGPLQLLRMSVSGGDKGNAGCTGSIDGKEPSSGNTSLHLQKLGSLMAPPFSSICHTCSRSLPSSFPFLCSSYTAPSTNEQLLEEVIQGMGPPGDLQPERSQWEAPNSLPCP